MSCQGQMLPVGEADLSRVLSNILQQKIRAMQVTALGSSSRETPWRVDLETGKGAEAVLLRLGRSCDANEVVALEAMKNHPLPTPEVLCWDPEGAQLGTPLFVSTFIEGVPLLDAMKTNNPWADQMYIDTACAVQSVSEEDLPPGRAQKLNGSESAIEVLEGAYCAFEKPNALAEAAYLKLKQEQPEFPANHFSNGDLWPENLLLQDQQLVGIIDWQHAGFGDPIYEFLLPFFLVPKLRSRGTEEAYCRRMGFDPAMLHWYRGLEFFDSLRWVLKTGKPYGIHTAESLGVDLEKWIRDSSYP